MPLCSKEPYLSSSVVEWPLLREDENAVVDPGASASSVPSRSSVLRPPHTELVAEGAPVSLYFYVMGALRRDHIITGPHRTPT